MDIPQSNPINPLIDPIVASVISNQILLPYTTILPAWTARNGYQIVYNDGTNYWLYIFTNGTWQSTKLYGTAGLTGSVTIPKITSPGGTNGSITYTNGIITAVTAPT